MKISSIVTALPWGRLARWRLLGALGVVLLVVVAHRAGAFANLDSIADVRAELQEAGPWGFALYILLLSVAEPLGVPGAVFVVAAGVVWPAPWALLLSWLGGMNVELIGFFFARWAGQGWVASRLPLRFRRFDARLEANGFWTVILLRLLFFMAAPVTWLLGVSSVRTREFVIATGIGLIPWIVALTLAGQQFMDWISSPWGAAAGILAVIAAGAVWHWRRPSRLRGLGSRGDEGDHPQVEGSGDVCVGEASNPGLQGRP